MGLVISAHAHNCSSRLWAYPPSLLRKMADEKSGASGSTPETSIKRLDFKKQTLDDAYAVPANLLEIEVGNPETHGLARNRYTDYEVKMRAS